MSDFAPDPTFTFTLELTGAQVGILMAVSTGLIMNGNSRPEAARVVQCLTEFQAQLKKQAAVHYAAMTAKAH